jgi:hypothetical protein
MNNQGMLTATCRDAVNAGSEATPERLLQMTHDCHLWAQRLLLWLSMPFLLSHKTAHLPLESVSNLALMPHLLTRYFRGSGPPSTASVAEGCAISDAQSASTSQSRSEEAEVGAPLTGENDRGAQEAIGASACIEEGAGRVSITGLEKSVVKEGQNTGNGSQLLRQGLSGCSCLRASCLLHPGLHADGGLFSSSVTTLCPVALVFILAQHSWYLSSA